MDLVGKLIDRHFYSLISIIFEALMYIFIMLVQICQLCILFVTQITSMPDTFMCRLNMTFQPFLIWKLFVTLIASILNTLMYRLNMPSQMVLFKILFITMIAIICGFTMIFDMTVQISLLYILFFTQIISTLDTY